MKTATVKELRTELNDRSSKELVEICLHLSKFKKENKELLTYLLYESEDEWAYIQSIKKEMDEQFEEMNTTRYYFIKKSLRKILRNVKKYIRYSKKKQTEVELRIYFCQKMNEVSPSIKGNRTLLNIYEREVIAIKKKVAALHEDLQFDYETELEDLNRMT